MSITLCQKGTNPELYVKTHPIGCDGTTIFFQGFTISIKDFLMMAEYVLENTDLAPDDPRRKFIERVREVREVEGYNEGMMRLQFPDGPCPEYIP